MYVVSKTLATLIFTYEKQSFFVHLSILRLSRYVLILSEDNMCFLLDYNIKTEILILRTCYSSLA
jgi:hypothetical protein